MTGHMTQHNYRPSGVGHMLQHNNWPQGADILSNKDWFEPVPWGGFTATCELSLQEQILKSSDEVHNYWMKLVQYVAVYLCFFARKLCTSGVWTSSATHPYFFNRNII